MNFINFHSHKIVHLKNVIQISSLTVNEVFPDNLPQHCTVGIHPWQSADENVSYMLAKLEQISTEPNVIAIGEVGLDRLRGADLQTQIELFKKQIAIAEKVQKPVVIHCVRSFSEIQQLRKQLKPTTHWVIHNFMGNVQIAQSLIQQGFYLSFCIAFAKNQKVAEALKATPIDKIFFETDDFIENVEDVYLAAAACLQMDLNELKVQIDKNFEAFFGTTPQ
jgi:TatD DNase family protein